MKFIARIKQTGDAAATAAAAASAIDVAPAPGKVVE